MGDLSKRLGAQLTKRGLWQAGMRDPAVGAIILDFHAEDRMAKWSTATGWWEMEGDEEPDLAHWPTIGALQGLLADEADDCTLSTGADGDMAWYRQGEDQFEFHGQGAGAQVAKALLHLWEDEG